MRLRLSEKLAGWIVQGWFHLIDLKCWTENPLNTCRSVIFVSFDSFLCVWLGFVHVSNLSAWNDTFFKLHCIFPANHRVLNIPSFVFSLRRHWLVGRKGLICNPQAVRLLAGLLEKCSPPFILWVVTRLAAILDCSSANTEWSQVS